MVPSISKEGMLHRLLIILAASGIISLLISLISGLGFLTPFNLKAYDGLFYLRAKLNARPPGYELDRTYLHRKDLSPTASGRPPIVLITIDDETVKAQELLAPSVLWHNEYAAIIKSLAQGQARVIGLTNLLPQNNFDEIIPGYSQAWRNSIHYARLNGVQVVSGFRVFAHKRLTPAEIYLRELGPDRLGFFNLTSDADDFIRRQQLWRLSANKSGRFQEPSFAYLLAHLWEPAVLTMPPPKSIPETIYIDYDPMPNPFPKFSFIEVYRQAAANNHSFFSHNFSGRLVLIGDDDILGSGARPTPLYYLASDNAPRRTTSHVELTAHTVSTLLRQSFITELKGQASWLIYLFLSYLVLLTGLKRRHRFGMIILSWSLALIYPAACLFLFHFNILLPLVGGLLALFISFFVCLVWHFSSLEQERAFTRKAFSHYLSEGVVEQVLKNPEQLTVGGIRREMTVFFADFVSFTSLAEKMQPDELVNLLNVYFSQMTKPVFNWGGTLDKFIGDSLMAFWGAPLLEPDHAAKACLSALEQQKVLLDLKASQLKQGRPVLEALMGVNTGNMAVGNIGTEERLAYSIIGDSVNLASRLVGLNKVYGTHIIISESTAQAAAGEIEARRLDHVRVFGRAESLVIYELLAERGGLDDKLKRVRDYYEEALSAYWAGQFKSAGILLEKALAVKSDDRPSQLLAARCQALLARPPADWDGITNYQNKHAGH